MVREALHAAEALGDVEDAERLHDLPGAGHGPDVEGEHAAEPAHLAAGQFVARMAGQSGVVDGGDLRMPGEHPCDLPSVRVVLLHPQRERLGTPQEEPGIERRQNRTRGVLEVFEAGQVLGVARHQDPADAIAMSVQVLGGGVHHDVGPQLEGPLEIGGHEGVVHHHHGACGASGRRESLEIRDPQQRVRGRFEEQHRGPGVQFADRAGGVARVHPGEIEPPGAQHVLAHPVGAAVAVVGGDDPAAARHQLEGHHDRRHSGSARHRPHASFERRHVRFEGVARRVTRSRVLVLARPARGLLNEGRRRDQGDDDGPGSGVGMLARMNRAGGEARGVALG